MVSTAKVPRLIATGDGQTGTLTLAAIVSATMPRTTRTARLTQSEAPSAGQTASVRTSCVAVFAMAGRSSLGASSRQ